MKCIAYNGGYKYQLKATFTFEKTGIIPPAAITTDYIGLNLDGNLSVVKGYAWDGTARPARPSTPKTSCAGHWRMMRSTS